MRLRVSIHRAEVNKEVEVALARPRVVTNVADGLALCRASQPLSDWQLAQARRPCDVDPASNGASFRTVRYTSLLAEKVQVDTVTDTDTIISRISEHGEEIRVEFGVARLGVFGSRVRDKARTDSDLDVLVEFSHPTFRNYMGLKRFLEHLIGVPVDLVSAAALKPLLKENILREVRYVA
jgi:predicted nucleotidyltransferase